MFNVHCTVQGIRTMADSTFRITVDCQEMNPKEMAEVFALKNKTGWFVFSENVIDEKDVPKVPVEMKEENPMASLTRTIYVFWDKCTSKKQPFNEFLRGWVEKKKEEIKINLPNS